MLGVFAVWFGMLSGASAQSYITVDKPKPPPITPKFTPVRKDVHIIPAYATEAAPRAPRQSQPEGAPPPTPTGIVRVQAVTEELDSIRPELPGIERMFMRDSEAEFYNRLRQEAKRTPGAAPLIFPAQTPLSKESYTQLPYPRIDPQTKQPFEQHVCVVEPSYVLHRRLFFEQPNFERAGYNFGILQPGICFGVFVYDLAFFPYHYWSDLHDRGDCNVGKCLPGDPYAPLLVPIERFSVTGAIGQAGAILGGAFIVP